MTEFVMVVLALIPLDVLPNQPTPTPSAAYLVRAGSRRLHPWWLFRPRHHRAGHGATQVLRSAEPSTHSTSEPHRSAVRHARTCARRRPR